MYKSGKPSKTPCQISLTLDDACKEPYQNSEPIAFSVFPAQRFFPSDPPISPKTKQRGIGKSDETEWSRRKRSKAQDETFDELSKYM